MPLFMMISGFFFSYKENNIWQFILKKGKHLILPTFVFGMVCILLNIILHNQIEPSLIITSYWFLKSAFICCILYVATSKLRYGWLLSIIISQFVYPYGVNLMYPSFLIGTLIKKIVPLMTQKQKYHMGITCGIIYLIMFVFWDPSFISQHSLKLYQIIGGVNSESNLIDVLFHIFRVTLGLFGASAIIFTTLSLQTIINKSGVIKILSKVGKHTMGIYLLQTIILEMLIKEYIHFNGYSVLVFDGILVPLLSLIVLIICLCIILLIQRNNKLSLIFLGKTH